MKSIAHQKYNTTKLSKEDYTPVSIMDSLEKTRLALEFAYAGFDNATDSDMIDSYIYEIKALQKRHAYLTALAAAQPESEREVSYAHPSVHSLVGHVLS